MFLFKRLVNNLHNFNDIPTKKLRNFKTANKLVAQTLESLLEVDPVDAHGILQNKNFKGVTKLTLEKNYALYINKGIQKETLARYPELLTVIDAEKKITNLETLPFKLDDIINLILFPKTNLINFIDRDKYAAKIPLLSSLLNTSNQNICKCIISKPFLIAMPIERIERKIQILKTYGVTTQDIINDLWVLKYSEKLIKTRLDQAQKNKSEQIKTWMVRAPEIIMESHYQRYSDQKLILGDNSLAEYLSKQLQCKITTANYLIMKQPALKNKSLKKLQELIGLLYDEGFKPQEIYRVPKILVHGTETIKQRLQLLREKGIKISSLSLLTKSTKQFMQYYTILLKNQNKTVEN